jgi:hypothetical protein
LLTTFLAPAPAQYDLQRGELSTTVVVIRLLTFSLNWWNGLYFMEVEHTNWKGVEHTNWKGVCFMLRHARPPDTNH